MRRRGAGPAGIALAGFLTLLSIAIAGKALAAPSGDPVAAAVAAVSERRIEADIRRLAAFGTRHTLSDTTSAVRGIGAAARWVEAQFDSISAANGGRLQVFRDTWSEPPGERTPQGARLANVVAILPGTSRGKELQIPEGLALPRDGDACYVVGGHLDSRAADVMDATSDAPGADDDASGVAVVLECARVLARERWAHTLVFIAFTGEEQNLFGSTHWAEMARAHGVRVGGVIANDMVGNTRAVDGSVVDTYIRVFSEGVPEGGDEASARLRAATGGENDSPSRLWARYVREAAERYAPDLEARLVFRRDRFLRGGDHIPFNRAGFTAVRITEPVENYDHQHQDPRTESGIVYGDLPEFVDFAFAARAARINVAALGEAAAAPLPPRGVVIDVSELSTDTTLRWEAAGGKVLAGYRVLWRDTTAPTWTHRRDVGAFGEVTLPVSKDDVVFGVQALGAQGHRSPVVVPVPKR